MLIECQVKLRLGSMGKDVTNGGLLVGAALTQAKEFSSCCVCVGPLLACGVFCVNPNRFDSANLFNRGVRHRR